VVESTKSFYNCKDEPTNNPSKTKKKKKKKEEDDHEQKVNQEEGGKENEVQIVNENPNVDTILALFLIEMNEERKKKLPSSKNKRKRVENCETSSSSSQMGEEEEEEEKEDGRSSTTTPPTTLEEHQEVPIPTTSKGKSKRKRSELTNSSKNPKQKQKKQQRKKPSFFPLETLIATTQSIHDSFNIIALTSLLYPTEQLQIQALKLLSPDIFTKPSQFLGAHHLIRFLSFYDSNFLLIICFVSLSIF